MSAATNWPAGDGEMARRIRRADWPGSPLGPIETWPQALRTAVDIMLAMLQPTAILWGAERVQLYNNAYMAVAKDRHPTLLGQVAQSGWPHGDADRPAQAMDGVFAGRSTRIEELVTRVRDADGRVQERSFDGTWSAIRDQNGAVAGALVIFSDMTDRRHVEADLRDSEARHRLLIESWAQAVWETDADGVVVADSPSWRAYTGQTLDAWMGYGWLDAIHPEDRAYAERQWREAVAAQGLVNAEFRLRAPDGRWRWTNVRAAPVMDARGGIAKWAGMNIDIDASKRAEAAVRDSEERYRTLFESIDEGFCIIEMIYDDAGKPVDFRFVEANPAFVRQTGWTDAIGRTMRSIAPALEEFWFETYGRIDATGDPERFEHRVASIGAWFNVFAFRIGAPAEHRIAILFDDVEQRKRAETALRESEERWRLASEVARLGAWDWDFKTDKVSWSDEHYHMQGYSPGEVTPSYEAWVVRVHPDDRPAAEASLRTARDGGQDYAHEFRSLHPDGTVRWLSARGRFFRDDQGALDRMVGAMVDVTERREWEERQQVMIAELQHRTRNLITVVRAIAGQTMARTGPTESFREEFNDRLAALARVQGLLSRSDEEPITLEGLIRLELDALGADDETGHVRVQGPPVRIRYSVVQTLALALHELATNARKYGGLSIDRGHLDVQWRTYADERGERLALTWAEEGGQPPKPEGETRRGYGRELIEQALPYSLNARTSFEHDEAGLRCTIDMPLRDAWKKNAA